MLMDWSEELRALLIRLETVDDRAAMDRAFVLLRQILAELPPGTRAATFYRYLESRTRQMRFERGGDPADLARAVEAGRETLAATPAGDDQRPMRMATLADSLLEVFKGAGDQAVLDEAITLYRDAAEAAPDHPLRANWLVNLGWALRARGDRVADPARVDEGVEVCRAALATAVRPVAVPSPGRDDLSGARLSNDLAQALRIRFQVRGDAADLDEAVALVRTAVAGVPQGHPDRAHYESNLGDLLREQFERSGSAEDLDGSVSAARAAVASASAASRQATPAPGSHSAPAAPSGIPAGSGSPGGSGSAELINLAAALQVRYQRLGDLADLDEAITVARRGIAGTSDEADRAVAQSNLGNALRGRFLRTRGRDDLDEAANVLAAAVAATPLGHPRRGSYLANLGGVLHLRFEGFREPADLREAMRAMRAAVDVTPPEHPLHGRFQGNLSLMLQERYDLDGARSDLDDAVVTAEAAVAAIEAGHPERAERLLSLGMACQLRHRAIGTARDEPAAREAWRQASAVATAPAAVRLRAARLWAEAAASAQLWRAGLEAYTVAVGLLPVVAWRGVGRGSREQMLDEWAGLGADAAACAIAAGEPRRAVELVEQGRAVLWSQLLEVRTDLAALRAAAPELAARMETVRGALDTADGVRPDDAMNLAREWEALLAEARALPGFEQFAGPPELGTLALDGPVAIVNVSRWRCDALLVEHGKVRVVPLGDLTAEGVTEQVQAYLTAVEGWQIPAKGDRDLRPVAPGSDAAAAATLTWLWDAIAEPVLAACGYQAVPEGGPWPRLWWCPTGLLALLPLHAAGHHHLPGRSVLDRAVSSYTSTLRVLAEANGRPPVAGNGRLLFIGLPSTPGQPDLPGVEAEQTFLRTVLPAARRTELSGPAATREAILAGTAAHPWVHASCHGAQIPDDPGSGGLLPYDWTNAGLVGVADVGRSDHPGGELAFLSACQTATISATNVDEVITLAAGLHHAGWRHVIGTLWTVGDTAAAELTRLVYPP